MPNKTYRVPVEFVAASDDAARMVVAGLARVLDYPDRHVVPDELTIATTYWTPVPASAPENDA
jgi:hypothetical protein